MYLLFHYFGLYTFHSLAVITEESQERGKIHKYNQLFLMLRAMAEYKYIERKTWVKDEKLEKAFFFSAKWE